jgi:hypothetical protein
LGVVASAELRVWEATGDISLDQGLIKPNPTYEDDDDYDKD